ncbi:hypothetical protein BLOT_000205 [Blomia tropicalis]|nr:hypothetical protein BLOT_000205 [Blomia tropicalis]
MVDDYCDEYYYYYCCYCYSCCFGDSQNKNNLNEDGKDDQCCNDAKKNFLNNIIQLPLCEHIDLVSISPTPAMFDLSSLSHRLNNVSLRQC